MQIVQNRVNQDFPKFTRCIKIEWFWLTCLADRSKLFAVCCDLCKMFFHQYPHPLPSLQVGGSPHFFFLAYFMGDFCCATPFCFIKMHDVMGYSWYQPIKIQYSRFKIRWNAINYSKLGHLAGNVIWPEHGDTSTCIEIIRYCTLHFIENVTHNISE